MASNQAVIPPYCYVTLTAQDGHKMMLPYRMAERCRVISYLFKALLFTETQRRACADADDFPALGEDEIIPTHSADDDEEAKYTSFVSEEPVPYGLSSVVVPLDLVSKEAMCYVGQYLMTAKPAGGCVIEELDVSSSDGVKHMMDIVRASDYCQI